MAHISLVGPSVLPVHAPKPPIASALGSVQQLELSAVSSTKSLIHKGPKHSPILYRQTLRIFTAKGSKIGDFSSIAVHSSRDFLRQEKWYPSLNPGTLECTWRRQFERASLASTPFDGHAGHAPIICAAWFIPSTAEATTSPPPRELNMHSDPSTLLEHHIHHPSIPLPLTLNASNPHLL